MVWSGDEEKNRYLLLLEELDAEWVICTKNAEEEGLVVVVDARNFSSAVGGIGRLLMWNVREAE